MNKSIGHIVNRGGGCFLNPPTHPTHKYSVNGRDFFMGLESAIESKWLDSATRRAAKKLLKNWQAPDIKTPEIQEWILQILGYFATCYKGHGVEPNCWHANNLTIDAVRNPLNNQDLHAGVHFIRKFYPDFVATAEQFQKAQWGK